MEGGNAPNTLCNTTLASSLSSSGGNSANTSCYTMPVSSYYSPSSMNSILWIVQKAIKLPLENKKPMVEAFLAVLLPFFVLVPLHSLIANPFLAKVEDGYENSSLNHQDIISLTIIEIPFAVTFCLLLLFASAITILASVSVVQQGAILGIKDTLPSFESAWKGILFSGFYILVMMIVFFGVSISLIQLTAVMGVLSALVYPFLSSFCTLMLVISTVEYKYQRKEVFKCAWLIIRRETVKVYFLSLMLVLLNAPVYVMFYVTSMDDDDENGLVMQFGAMLVSTVLFCLTVFYSNVVCTLFYLDYKQRNGEIISELESKYYRSVPTAANMDI